MSTERTSGTQDRLSKDAAASTTQNAALRGASLAFGKPPVKPKPNANTYSGNNGALAAATRAGAGGTGTLENKASVLKPGVPAEQQPSRNLSFDGRSKNSSSARQVARKSSTQSLSQNGHFGNGLLRPGIQQTQSASFIAANLAASRSPSVSPITTTGQQTRPSTNFGIQRTPTKRAPSPAPSTASSGNSDPLDLTPIAKTTSLIDMFEKTGFQPYNRPQAVRPVSIATTRRNGKSLRAEKSPLSNTRAISPSLLPVQAQKPEGKALKPPKLQQRETAAERNMEQTPIKAPAKLEPFSSRRQQFPEPKEDDYASSSASPLSSSDYKPSFRAEIQNQKRRMNSSSAVSINSSVTIDDLANAIVASSLASSRAASPSRNSVLAPAPPPTRRSPRGHLFHSSNNSRTASPAKPVGMRTTLRKPKLSEDSDEGDKRRKKKPHLMKKHPNKHHEGDRKRWRDQVTDRERKRYEAVWASNKGLHLSSISGTENLVCNLVVRDIWQRSRLHADVLEEVYGLVDKDKNKMLGRREFVVGLWLVDQRLKGRKLPIRVSDSVWASVDNPAYIKVKKPKH